MICSICGRTLLPSATSCPSCKGKPRTAPTPGHKPAIIDSSFARQSGTQNKAGKNTLIVLGGITLFLVLLFVGATILGTRS